MFRPDEANNLVQQPPREPQVAAEVLGFRANCEVVTKERVVAENMCGKREIQDDNSKFRASTRLNLCLR
jgi:hypothetical protein